MALSAQQLIRFLIDSRNIAEIDENTALFSDGTIDSVGMIELIAYIESSTGIVVEHADVTLSNFDTIARILHFLAQKQ